MLCVLQDRAPDCLTFTKLRGSSNVIILINYLFPRGQMLRMVGQVYSRRIPGAPELRQEDYWEGKASLVISGFRFLKAWYGGTFNPSI